VNLGNPGEPPAWARELLSEARVAHLGLLDDSGAPRVQPISFALAEGRIWSAIDQKPKRTMEPARVRFLRRDARAALTVDRYSDDWGRLAWVQVLASVEVLELDRAAPGLAALGSKYDQYREEPPPGPVLALEPARWLWWRSASD
jgi:PPOX class probable F420-dependent enzyme